MINQKSKNKSRNLSAGFTLVEMLVAIAVFMSVMVVAVGALMSIINANKKNQAIKNVVDNVTFALDSISRDMRSGMNYKCSTDGSSYTTDNCINNATNGVNYIQYTMPDKITNVYYRFLLNSNPQLILGYGNIQKCLGSGCPSINWQSMTAPTSTVNVKNMKFYVLGIGDIARQPRVIITAQGSVITKSGTADFSLQTTVSQRSR